MNGPKPTSPDPAAQGAWALRDYVPVDALLRWPVYLARFEWLRLRQLARSPRGPAGAMIATNLCWLIPVFMFSQYAQMYALELGLSKVQIGYLGALTTATSVVFCLVGGWLTDRLGYLRTVLLFDTLSWPLPMALLAAASQPWHFYLAAGLAGTMSAVVPGWHALFVSGVARDRRAAAYGMLGLVNNVLGLGFPLAGGWLIGRLGLEPGMRVLYLGSAWLMAVGVILRRIIIPDTPPLRRDLPSLHDSAVEQFRIYIRLALRPELRAFFLGLAFINVFIPVMACFGTLYCMDYLGLPKAQFAWVTAAAGLAQLPATLLLAPLITARRTRAFFLLVAAALAASVLVYLVFLRGPSPAAPLMLTVIIASVLSATGMALWGPAILSQWTNLISEDIRSRLWGAHGAFNGALAAAALAAVGHVYARWSPSLMVAGLVLILAAGACFALSPVGTERLSRLRAEG